MFAHRNAWIGLVAVLALTAVGCTTTDGQSDNSKYSKKRAQPTQTVQEPQIKRVSAPEGFYAEMHDGRIWVFKEDAKELQKFLDGGELAKHVIRPGAGPGGATLKAPDMETIIEYMAAKPGFHTAVRDGRIWVFKEDAKELQKFREGGELAKHVIRPGAGPSGVTLKAPDTETIIEYMAAKRGFHTSVHDGRIWVFREDSKELQKFKDMGELAKHVIRPGAGPSGITLKAPDTETIIEYMAAKRGFHTSVHDGRIWVFREDSKELQKFKDMGELAKHVIRPGAGPGGTTLKAPDTETLNSYLAAR